MTSRHIVLAMISSVLVAGWLVLGACSNMSEGERCEVGNNNDDCEDGLVCIRKEDVARGYENADRCCPPPPLIGNHPACKGRSADTDGAAPPDSGPPVTPDAATPDAPSDTGIDTGVDGAADSSADADEAG